MTAIRDDHGRFQPGTGSPNASGRPKGFRGVARSIMDQTNDGQELVAFALRVLRDDAAEMRDRLAAHAWLSDRALGKPMQTLELSAHVEAVRQGSGFDSATLLSRLSTAAIKELAELAEADAAQEPRQLDHGDHGEGPR